MRTYLAALLVIYAYNIFLATGNLDESYCFQFTWRGSTVANDDCKNISKNIPCVKPIDYSDTKPNTTEIWEKKNEKEYMDYFCKLEFNSNVCIRYTYIYNNAIVNVSYFCGRVIVDQTSPVMSGCYAQRTEGYTIEACACQSKNNTIPCNATIRNMYSTLITAVAVAISLFMYKIFVIPSLTLSAL